MSSGLYTHITSAPGTLVSATLYNRDHKTHLLNDIPTEAGGVSDDLTQYQTTVDPYPAAVATPVASMGEEIEQLRFVVQDIKNFLQGAAVAQWYTPVTTPYTQDGVIAKAAQSSITTGMMAIPDTTLTSIVFDQVDYDTGVNGTPFWDVGNPTRLTAPVTGLYDLSASLEWLATMTAPNTGQFLLRIRADGTTYLNYMAQGANGLASDTRFMSCNTQMQLTAGQYVEMVVEQSEAGGSIWNAQNPQMTMVLISSQQPITNTSVTVTFRLGLAPTGFIVIDDGTGPNTYPVTASVDDFAVLQVSLVADGTVVTMEAQDGGMAPFCNNPGQSFTSSWTGEIVTNCGSGYAYLDTVTILASESTNGNLQFTAFP